MNCQEYRGFIEDALDVLLHGEPGRRVRLHLEHCASCRNYFTMRRDEHVALFSGINVACEELHLPKGFADRLAESVRNRRAARRGWRHLALPRWALIAASLAAMAGIVLAAPVAIEAVLGGMSGRWKGAKATEAAAFDAAVASVSSGTSPQLGENEKGEMTMGKTTAAAAALTAAFAAAPLAAADGGGDYQFIISGDPVAAETADSSSDSSAASALESGTLAGGAVLKSALEARHCTCSDSPMRSLRSDKIMCIVITVR